MPTPPQASTIPDRRPDEDPSTMQGLLHVIANPKEESQSVSRQLATDFFARRRSSHPAESIETLDLYREDIPLLDAAAAETFTKGALRKEGDPVPQLPLPSWSLAASDRYAAQYLRCERIVITTPLWNFGPPAILKAWIDLIVREGVTFVYTPHGPRPLAMHKRLLILGSRGGVYSGDSPLKPYDFLEPYLRSLFGFLGAQHIDSVWAEGTTYPDTVEARASLKQAKERVADLAATF